MKKGRKKKKKKEATEKEIETTMGWQITLSGVHLKHFKYASRKITNLNSSYATITTVCFHSNFDKVPQFSPYNG